MIASHFGWTVDYILNGLPWITIQLMLADEPWTDHDNPKGEKKAGRDETVIDLDSDEDLIKYFSQYKE